ncbi:hypothetical protein NXX23_28285 [Bacteroides ovatus]|nr:hypothetical protein [Bacteroides ovatus]
MDGAVTTVKDYTMQRGDYLLADGNLLPKGTTLTEEQKASVAFHRLLDTGRDQS